jgi:hypothetical protein
MKHIGIIVVGVLAVTGSAYGQTRADIIERALAAAPPRTREAAAVIRWNPDHTYETLKEGPNLLVCYDRSGEPGQQPFSVQCANLVNLDRVAQNRRFRAESANASAMQAMLAAAEANGTRVKPQFGSLWLSMDGSDRANARMSTSIAVPGATTASIGLPETPRQGGAWIMDAGTSAAHIMTPTHFITRSYWEATH